MRMDPVRGPDAGTLLVRALRGAAAAAGVVIHVESIGGRPWASATFSGTRHRVVLRGAPIPAFRSWLTTLPEAEFAIAGHLVADLLVEMIDDNDRATLSVLTLVEG